MKVSFPKTDGNNAKKKELPPLPLKPEEVTEDNELKLAKFKLRTDPPTDTSPVYSFTMVKLDGSETLRTALKFYLSITKVWTGLNITTAANKLTITRELMSGQALQQFNTGYQKAVNLQWDIDRNAAITALLLATPGSTQAQQDAAANGVGRPVDHVDYIMAGLGQIIEYMAPHKALAKQKRWMRRFCRKPADMTIREFCTHLTRINDEELPVLPPFGGGAQKLSNDEIIDIILNGIPRSWTREMDKLDFDPVVQPLSEVLNFCERMEAAEDFEPARDGKKTNGNGKKSPNKPSANKTGKGGYCLLHGDNPTHTTDECHVLKKQAKSLRSNDGAKKPAFKNKTWKRDADKSTNSSKKELATFVRKQARKELYAFAKKRKVEEDAEDLNNIEMEDGEEVDGEIDLSIFNYSKMGNLKIDSDDESEDDDDKTEVSA